jgi:hypothetical protein
MIGIIFVRTHFNVRYKEYMFSLVTGIVVARSGLSLPRLRVTSAKQQPLQMGVHVTDLKGPSQMMCDLFKVFT